MSRTRKTSETRGARPKCDYCGHQVQVKPGQEWEHRMNGGVLRIVHCDRDGAIVEQVGREGREDRWGVSYRSLLVEFRKVAK